MPALHKKVLPKYRVLNSIDKLAQLYCVDDLQIPYTEDDVTHLR